MTDEQIMIRTSNINLPLMTPQILCLLYHLKRILTEREFAQAVDHMIETLKKGITV